jgi:Zn-dependent M28 family amino/carboxypeptidase
VLNMDMIANKNSAVPTVLLEGATVSSSRMDDLATAAATYTGLKVETSLNPFASDHVPFINAGIPAVLTIEGADSANGHIHTATDTLNFLDWALAAEILRMNVAALAGWLEPISAETRPRPAGSVVAWGPDRLDVFAVGVDSAMHHKAFDGTWNDFESLGGVVLT